MKGIVFLLLAAPFLLLIFFAKEGANDCVNNIEKGLPSAVQGNTNPVTSASQKYCDANTGNFLYVKKTADLINQYYPPYLLYFVLPVTIVIILFGRSS